LTQTLKLRHQPGWLLDADATLKGLQAEVPWQQDSIQIFGQRRLLPRLTCWMADPGFAYTYSGEQQIAQPWIPRVLDLRCAANAFAGCAFNSVLINLYRDGDDRMGWHADDEPELDPSAPIASLSLGATRSFRFKPKGRGPDSRERHCLELGHGDLLLMDPPTQQHWLHELPRRRRVSQPRLNLTFRLLRPS